MLSHFNQTIFQSIHNLASRNGFLDGIAIFTAQYLPYLLVLAFLVLVLRQAGWRRKLYLFAEAALSLILARGLVVEIIRLFYQVDRPFVFYNFTPLIPESGWSFPSGHAAFFFALAMTIWYANKKWGTWYFIFAVLIGIARIYTGVHWPLDIIAGLIVGVASAVVVHYLLKQSREGLLQ